MSLDVAATKPLDRLAAALSAEMEAVNVMIRARMASEHAPRIPQVTAHLVEAGGQTAAPDADPGCGETVWLYRDLPHSLGRHGRVYPYRHIVA